MRQDISKVFNEPARSKGVGTAWPHRVVHDEEDLPVRISMRELHSRNWGRREKSQNRNYAVIKRWLRAQVGRSWDDVYGDISRQAPFRTFAGNELREYVVRQVELNAFVEEDGRVMAQNYGGYYEVTGLYVHPSTKVLSFHSTNTYRTNRRVRDKAHQDAEKNRRRVLSATVQLHKLEGQWFEVTLAPLTPPKTIQVKFTYSDGHYEVMDPSSICFDIVLHRPYRYLYAYLLKETYGDSALYAVAKRQLSSKEMKAYGLV